MWYFPSRYRLYIRQPEIIDVEWGNFFAPFGSDLWLGILAVVFVISAMAEACHRLLRRFGTCSAELLYRPPFQDSLFHVFAAFCAQGITSNVTCHFLHNSVRLWRAWLQLYLFHTPLFLSYAPETRDFARKLAPSYNKAWLRALMD
jgi:hypothetical protein